MPVLDDVLTRFVAERKLGPMVSRPMAAPFFRLRVKMMRLPVLTARSTNLSRRSQVRVVAA